MRNVRLMLGATLIAGTAASIANAGVLSNDFTREVGLIVLNPDVCNAVTISGSGVMRVPRILVNSSNDESIVVSGNGTLRARYIHTAGYTSFGNAAEVTGLVLRNAGAVENPFENLVMPDSADYGPDNGYQKFQGGSHVIDPGYYSGGIEIKANARVQLMPGNYYLDGLGFKALSGTIVGTGVTIHMIGGAFDLGGNADVSLEAPTSGDYEGIVVCQDPGNTNAFDMRGGSDFTVRGTVYAPSAHVTITGNGGVDGAEPFFGDLMVCDTVAIGGNGAIRVGEWIIAGNLPTAPLYD